MLAITWIEFAWIIRRNWYLIVTTTTNCPPCLGALNFERPKVDTAYIDCCDHSRNKCNQIKISHLCLLSWRLSVCFNRIFSVLCFEPTKLDVFIVMQWPTFEFVNTANASSVSIVFRVNRGNWGYDPTYFQWYFSCLALGRCGHVDIISYCYQILYLKHSQASSCVMLHSLCYFYLFDIVVDVVRFCFAFIIELNSRFLL